MTVVFPRRPALIHAYEVVIAMLRSEKHGVLPGYVFGLNWGQEAD